MPNVPSNMDVMWDEAWYIGHVKGTDVGIMSKKWNNEPWDEVIDMMSMSWLYERILARVGGWRIREEVCD